MPRRKINRVIHSTSSEQLSEPSASSLPELGGQEPTSTALRVQDQLLDDETRALQVTNLYAEATLILLYQ